VTVHHMVGGKGEVVKSSDLCSAKRLGQDLREEKRRKEGQDERDGKKELTKGISVVWLAPRIGRGQAYEGKNKGRSANKKELRPF